eukprot:1922146-Pyramimonas_sp.AAC.1
MQHGGTSSASEIPSRTRPAVPRTPRPRYCIEYSRLQGASKKIEATSGLPSWRRHHAKIRKGSTGGPPGNAASTRATTSTS